MISHDVIVSRTLSSSSDGNTEDKRLQGPQIREPVSGSHGNPGHRLSKSQIKAAGMEKNSLYKNVGDRNNRWYNYTDSG